MKSLYDGLSSSFLHFRDPLYLLLILLLPVLYFLLRNAKEPSIIYPSLRYLRKIKPTLKMRVYPLSKWVRYLVLLLVVLALARFQKGRRSIEVITHGVDIILAVDTSGSMRAEDFHIKGKRVTRLDAVKEVVQKFVKDRESDRLGMVVFGSMAFTQCPLTLDHGVFLTFLKDLQIGMAGEQTAIGSAIGTAVNRLKDLEARSKVMILLTDGANTAGNMDPVQAAEIAASFGIKVYTIGVGGKGEAPFLVQTVFGPQYQYIRSDLDEYLLKEVASKTGGKYFHASNTEELEKVYKEIDKMEKRKAKTKEHMEFTELFHLFLIPAVVLMFLNKLLDISWFRRIP